MNPQPTPSLFTRPVGAYRRLHSFTLATIIQTETWRFCREFLDLRHDPKGRWFDQMTQAARSGRANCLMVLILRAMTLLHRQLTRLASDFALTGGLREQMSATRRAAHAFHAPQR